jgi:Na+-transporting NADH:ubiquinone oxidoreductase subunit NqrC
LQAITGATQTCNGVINMINTDLQFYLEVIRSNFDLIKKKMKKMA